MRAVSAPQLEEQDSTSGIMLTDRRDFHSEEAWVREESGLRRREVRIRVKQAVGWILRLARIGSG